MTALQEASAAYAAKKQMNATQRERLMHQINGSRISFGTAMATVKDLVQGGLKRCQKGSRAVVLAWLVLGERWFCTLIKLFSGGLRRRVYLWTSDLLVEARCKCIALSARYASALQRI